MPSSRQAPQRPGNPDAILPVDHTHTAEHENLTTIEEEPDITEYLTSIRHLFKEASFDDLSGLIAHIRSFCHRRGEPIDYFIKKLLKHVEKNHKSVNLPATIDNLETALDRAQEGEFLISFDRKVFDEFQADKIVVLGRNEGFHRLEKSKRPVPRSDHTVVTTLKTVQNAGLQSEDPILRPEWVSGIQAIARAYERYWPQLAQVAREWEHNVLTGVGKNVGNVLWKVYGKGKYIRSNLIYAGEKVRTGEKLPEPEVMVKGNVGHPQNVDPSDPCFVHNSHSLARISIRGGRRIRYKGTLAHYGGMYFS